MDYQKLYSKLFNGITDTIEQLKELQIQAEEDYLKMSDGTTDRKVIPFNPHKTNSDASQETYLLVVDDDNYNKLLSELYVGEWHEPDKSVLDNVLAKGNDLTWVQYTDTKKGIILFYVSNERVYGKHLINFYDIPYGCEKSNLTDDDRIAILEKFKNSHKNIKFENL